MATNTPLPATSMVSNTPPNEVYGDESGFFVMGIQSRNPKESEVFERSEDEQVLLCLGYILTHLLFLFDIHSAS